MTLIIETGTGSATAEAYADAAAYVAWAIAFDGAAPTDTTTATEAAIRRAVAYMDGLRWTGTKTFGRVQARAWPRAYVCDRDGWAIASNVIPAEIIEAQHMLTKAELAAPGCLAPSVAAGARQKVLTGLGEMSWTVAPGATAPDAQRTVVLAAMDRLKGLVTSGGTLVRA